MTYHDDMLGDLFDELFPICRSITGPGLRRSLDIFARYMPLQLEHTPTGSEVFDWTVPPEWHIESARLTGPDGRVIVDFADNNLHIVNYAEPVNRRLTLDDLQPHLHSLPEQPDAVPYVTSYYRRDWGFCLPHRVRDALPPGDYHVVIDSRFVDGGIDLSQCRLPGATAREILLSSYLCHPSMANNELSGPLVLLGLYHRIAAWPRRRHSFRFVLNPETIGSLCFLHRHHEELAANLVGGLVLTCLGGPVDNLSYKQSRAGDGLIDRVLRHVARDSEAWALRPFTPEYGSDERQYCSPGFNFSVGNVARTVYGAYPGYHNSLDDKAFMDVRQLLASIDQLESLLRLVDVAGTFVNTRPYGEPQLGKYDLYPSENSARTRQRSNDVLKDRRRQLNLVLQVLSHCDGESSLIDLAASRDIELSELAPVIALLEDNGLLVMA